MINPKIRCLGVTEMDLKNRDSYYKIANVL